MLGTNGADPAITGYHSCSLVANCLRFKSSNMDGGSMMLLAFFFCCLLQLGCLQMQNHVSIDRACARLL